MARPSLGLLLAAAGLHIVRAALEVRYHPTDILRAVLLDTRYAVYAIPFSVSYALLTSRTVYKLVVFRLHPPPTTSLLPGYLSLASGGTRIPRRLCLRLNCHHRYPPSPSTTLHSCCSTSPAR